MTGPMMVKRAETMVAWFDNQPDHSTTKTDGDQAREFHNLSPAEGWVNLGCINGNVALVRQVRRWISKQADGQFAQYVFNTKRSGRGVTWTNMSNGQARRLSATIGTAAQVEAAEQHERRIGEEIGRIVLKLNAEAEEWFQLQDYQRSMVCRDGANDFEQFGRFRPATKQAFERLGLAQP